MIIICKPAFHKPQPCAGIDALAVVWTEACLKTLVEVLAMRLRDTVVVDTLLGSAFVDAFIDLVCAGTVATFGAEMGIRADVVVEIFIDVLFGDLGGEITAFLTRMGVVTLTGVDVELLAAVMAVLEFIL